MLESQHVFVSPRDFLGGCLYCVYSYTFPTSQILVIGVKSLTTAPHHGVCDLVILVFALARKPSYWSQWQGMLACARSHGTHRRCVHHNIRCLCCTCSAQGTLGSFKCYHVVTLQLRSAFGPLRCLPSVYVLLPPFIDVYRLANAA